MRAYQEMGEVEEAYAEGSKGESVSERVSTTYRGGQEKGRDSWYSFDFGRAAVVSSGNPTFHPVSYYPFRHPFCR